eukprot:345567-Lingulodinium_polyedra.AAC.1
MIRCDAVRSKRVAVDSAMPATNHIKLSSVEAVRAAWLIWEYSIEPISSSQLMMIGRIIGCVPLNA